MVKNISHEDFLRLKIPCKNRNATIVNNGDGSVSINGNKFGTMQDCENYLININRVDLRGN